ncbi:MAG: PspC domain-containing protein [Lachnospiraceae bacterium]|nr:PspC domain-containing protein [Lachnospiraceae bacterium]
MRKLYKSRDDKKIFGVCGGIAQFFGIDSTLVRIVTVLLVAVGGMSIWIYVIAALIMSAEPAYGSSDYQS